MSKDTTDGRKVIARNKKALHDYHILDRWEAGLVLTGPEVKSIRDRKVSIGESYARVQDGEVWLHGMHVSPYDPAATWNTDATRARKLLLQKKEIRRLIGATQDRGLTLVPLDLYFRRGYARITLALGKGKKLHDKREDLKRKDAEREVQRAFRQHT
ncbi:MAG TPA: SsrA-binding protein SmpB [Longimicrobiales bacterium]|nr:SsrA-binding protein SmpB [Longimicrobiales bacterium]